MKIKYHIKKYYKKKKHNKYITYATVYKKRLGFLIDILEVELNNNYELPFEYTFNYPQTPISKKESNTIINLLNKKL